MWSGMIPGQSTMMKKRARRFSLNLNDDSRLRRIASVSMPLWQWILAVIALGGAGLLMSGVIVGLTPLRKLLPGFMEESTRALTEENIMRLDSLQAAYEKDRAYVENILTVFDTDRQSTDSASLVVNPRPLTADSVMSRTPEEEKFIKMMEQREKYNLSILAPLAAEGMLFNPPSDECVFTAATRKSTAAEIIIPSDSPVGAIADGMVLDTFFSPSDGGNVIIIQHGNGFASRISRLGNMLVSRGDYVQAGQIIAFPQSGHGRDGSRLMIEIWRNSDPLIPFELIGH